MKKKKRSHKQILDYWKSISFKNQPISSNSSDPLLTSFPVMFFLFFFSLLFSSLSSLFSQHFQELALHLVAILIAAVSYVLAAHSDYASEPIQFYVSFELATCPISSFLLFSHFMNPLIFLINFFSTSGRLSRVFFL